MNATTADSLKLDPRTYARGRACVHCGLCLPACPTYTETQNEADSPRGRIQLMLALSDGTIEATESVRTHLDLCLDCRGCETACPSGVVYHELIEETRHHLAENGDAAGTSGLMRWVFFHILTHPFRLKLSLIPARIAKAIGLFKILPPSLRKMGQMIPAKGSWWPARLPEKLPAIPKSQPSPANSVAFFPTCVGSVVQSDVSKKAAHLLQATNSTVHIPHSQQCCGAIHLHNGDSETAKKLAKENIDVLTPAGSDVKYVVTAVAGCGAMLREYGHLLRDDTTYRERAAGFSAKVRDVSEVLLELGLPPAKSSVEQKVTYHDACHLAHAQNVSSAPRKLLTQIPGLTLVALPENDMCCGAAGTYNLTEPEMATRLAKRKLANIAQTQCTTCAAGNVGCAMHIQSQADASGQQLQVVHPIELLHEAIFGKD